LSVNFYRCFLPSFSSFVQAVSGEKILKKLANQKQELPMVAMFVDGSGQNEQSSSNSTQSSVFHGFLLPNLKE
jgi:hypothetical protein